MGDGEIVSEIVPEVMGFVPEVEGDAEAVHEVVGVRPGRAGRLGSIASSLTAPKRNRGRGAGL